MAFETIFKPLQFRNLTVKNRIFRSNVSGRFDNYDGSGNQARINWEAKFAEGRRRRDHLLLRAGALRGRIVPNYAMIDHDRHIPFWRAVGEAVHKPRLQVHPAAEPRRPAARHRRHRVPEGPVLDRQGGPAARLQCERMTVAQIRRSSRTSPRARGARARPASTASSCTAPTAT